MAPKLKLQRATDININYSYSIADKTVKFRKLAPQNLTLPPPAKLVTQKNLPLNRPSEYKPLGACTWKLPSNTKKNKAIALK